MNSDPLRAIAKAEFENLKWQIKRVYGEDSRLYGDAKMLEKVVHGCEPVEQGDQL